MSNARIVFKGVFLLIILLGLLIGFYISTFSILVSIADGVRNDNTYFDEFIHDYFSAISFITPVFFILLFILVYRKRKDFLKFTSIWLAILFSSFLVASLLSIAFGNSEHWYLKYTLGLFIGTITYLLSKDLFNPHIILLTGIFSVFALFLGEEVEYFMVLDPSLYPSTKYPQSFPNEFIWLTFILIVVIPASIISKGFIINNFIKSQRQTEKKIDRQ